MLSVSGSHASTIGEDNPLRYRGYVYDKETKLYYLESRYYNPAYGRFINADAYAATGQGFVGNNMFAYCLNNPVNMMDESGNLAKAARNAELGGGRNLAKANKKIVEFEGIITEDEEEVLEAHGLIVYKGVPVIKSSFLDNNGFSFGVIVLGNNVKGKNLVKHEYGHVMQLKEIGLSDYVEYVAIPSITCFVLTEINIIPKDIYYSLPWERMADYLGGVSERQYYEKSEEIMWRYWNEIKKRS